MRVVDIILIIFKNYYNAPEFIKEHGVEYWEDFQDF